MSVKEQAAIFFEDGWALAEEIVHEIAHDRRKLVVLAGVLATAVTLKAGQTIKAKMEQDTFPGQ